MGHLSGSQTLPGNQVNLPGAIADFQALVESPDISAEQKVQHQAWIRDLQAGKNLFTPEVLDSLK